MKEKTDLLREAIEKEFTLELNPLLENFKNDFNSNIRTFYLQAKANHDLINHEDDNRKRQEQTAFKNLMKQQYGSEVFKDFFNDLSLKEYALEDKIVKLYADERTIKSFLIQKNSIKGSPCDFFSVCLGVSGWKNFKSNNIPKRIKKTEQDIQEKLTGNNGSLEKNNVIGLNNISNLEIENYVPRISIVEEISNLFEQKNKKINITGISGNGKTFLARHFVQHYSERFSHIVWLNCSEGLSKAFTEGKGAKLLDKIGLSAEHLSFVNGNMKVKSLVDMLLGRLQSIQENSILVLDNVDEEILFYENELNLFTNWKILTTSQESLDGFCNYPIPSFEEVALTLFYKYYTLEVDDDNLTRLLSVVEYHTLTIELLAKTAHQKQLTIIELVNRFIKNGINVVERARIFADHNIERNTKIENIEEYLNIVFDSSVLSEEECKILLNIAILQTEPIEINLFKEVYLNDSSDNKVIDVFEHNISILSSKGWIQMESDGIRLHSLVKSIIIKKFIHKNDYFDITVQYLGKKIKASTIKKSLRLEYLKLSESLLENYTQENNDIIYLKFAVSLFLHDLGLYQKAVNILHGLQEAEDINVIIGKFHNLSISALNQDNYEKALFYSNQVHSLLDDKTRKELFLFTNDALTTFVENNKIKIPSDFESNSWLVSKIQVVLMVLNCHSIIIMCDGDYDILKKIKSLKQLVSVMDKMFSILEKNIPHDVLFSSRRYEDMFLSKDTILRKIGLYYVDLNEYDKAEKFLKNTLWVKENKWNENNNNLSLSYNALTTLYLRNENLEEAKYFIEKNRKICEIFPPNHPNCILYKSDLANLEKIEKEKVSKEESENKIKSQFEILFDKNPNSTFLQDYYYTLSCIYYEFNILEKALEYAKKEVQFISNIGMDDWFLVNAYVRLGMCNLQFGNFDEAIKSHEQAQSLYNEKKINHGETQKRIFNFKNYLLETAFKSNYLPLIKYVVKNELLKLHHHYCNYYSELLSSSELINLSNKIIDFLSDLPDMKDNINWVNTKKNWIESLEIKVEEFIVNYNLVFTKSLQEITEIEPNSVLANEMRNEILRDYYQKVADNFNKYEKWDVAVQYYFRKLSLFDLGYVDYYNGIENVYYEISVCFFRLQKFEISYEMIREGIKWISDFIEIQNHTAKNKERLIMVLNKSLNLEKIIKTELEKFKNKKY